MDMNKLRELLEKVTKLKNLREAVKIYKSMTLKKDQSNVVPIRPLAVSDKQAEKTGAKAQLSEFKPSNKQYLSHMGIKDTGMNKRTHMIGLGGSGRHYEVHVNLDKLGSKVPAFEVNHVKSDGTVLNRSPVMHKDIKSAVKAVVGHHITGKWE